MVRPKAVNLLCPPERYLAQGCFYFILSSDTALLTKTMHHGQRDCASIVMTLKETEAVQLTMVLSLLSSTVFHDLAFVTWWRM